MNLVRVDTVPVLLKPVFSLYGYGLGALWYVIQRATIRVVTHHVDRLVPDRNYIFCLWHASVPLALQGSVPGFPHPLRNHPHAWTQHPLWYMKPVHILLRLVGVRRIVLGSTGHDGRQAADQLVDLLRAGYSTVVLPDGPAGPARVLKRGVLHLAAQSGVPIAPIRVRASRALTAPTWDRKQPPLPFTTIRFDFGAPITVNHHQLRAAERELTSALG